MNITHNQSRVRGIQLVDMQVGQVYLSLAPSPTPLLYMACCNPGHPIGRKVDFLVNLGTGCRVVPRAPHSYGFKHLPDATLDTGT